MDPRIIVYLVTIVICGTQKKLAEAFCLRVEKNAIKAILKKLMFGLVRYYIFNSLFREKLGENFDLVKEKPQGFS